MDEFEFPEHRIRSRTFVTPTRNGINQSVIHPMPFSPADENNQDADHKPLGVFVQRRCSSVASIFFPP